MSSSSSPLASTLALLLQATLWALPLTAPSPAAAELRPAEPIRCNGYRQIQLRDRSIETPGDAIVVDGFCQVTLTNCHLVAGGVAVKVQGKGRVKIEDSVVDGQLAALQASGASRIEHTGTTVRGAVQVAGLARIDGDTAAEATRIPSGDARIRIDGGRLRLETDDAEMSVGVGGIKLKTDEAAAEIGAGGIRLETDEASAGIGAGGLRLETDDAEMAIGAATEWRTRGTTYRSADTEQLLRDLGAEEADGRMSLALAGDVLFDFSSADIRSPAAVQLAKVAHVIRERSAGEVQVIGHTDAIGSDADNQKLSERRALAVMRWLHGHEGIPAGLMRGQGMGAKKPIDYNTMPDGSDNPQGRARNRRVEIYFAVRP